MSDVIRWNNQFYILASSSLADSRVEVLKHGETFAVFDRYGDIHQDLPGPQGLYHEGTRFLSRFELSLGPHRPLLVSTTVKEDNALLTIDLTNPDIASEGQELVPRGTLHLCRTRFLWQGTCHERISIHNYGGSGFPLALTIYLALELSAAKLKVGIVSRGYGRRGGGARYVHPDSDWRDVGDEPLIVARRTGCPTLVAADRVAAARTLIARGADVILSDDGLQHLRMPRDCEIVVIDGSRGFGNGHLLPAGPLREPTAALGRADVVVVNGDPTHGSLENALPAGTLAMRLEAQPAVRLDGRGAPSDLGRDRQPATLLSPAHGPRARGDRASLPGPSPLHRARARL